MARKVKGKIDIDVNDIVGTESGKLQVLEYYRHWYDVTAGGDRFRHSYLCRCGCGKLVIVRRQCLLNKTTKSCGCSRKGRKRKRGNQDAKQ